MKLSVIILTKNEEKTLEDCLKSVNFADEIIIIDDESTDKTRNIASKFTSKIYINKKIDFSNQREFGLKKASGEWILYVDADERIRENLKREIQKVISQEQQHSGFFIKRENFYLGGKWPYREKVQRLFKREKLKGWYGKLHETPIIEGTFGILRNPLIHITHRDLSSMLAKTIEWSKIEARLRFEANHPKVTCWRFFRVMLTEFLRYYIGQKGYKAGTAGLIESLYQSFSIFITYARLYEIQSKKIR